LRVGLFDYGAGNLHSLKKALESGGAAVTTTHQWEEALAQDAMVLPGVGSFGAAVRSLGKNRSRIRDKLQAGYPCLGICLGMQLLLESSEEGKGQGIGFIPGPVRRLRGRIIPQMGWNDVETGTDPLFRGVQNLVAYYANSFVCEPSDPTTGIATTTYDGQPFPAGIRRGLTWGVQFHPEKSSAPGLRIIQNFLEEIP
jgi:glutamine amidotransferase